MSGKTTSWKYLMKMLKSFIRSNVISVDTTHAESPRTLFYDYGPFDIKLGDWSMRINIWTATGQDFYCVTRETVLQGTDGIIFVADSQKDLFLENVKSWRELLAFYRGSLEQTIPVTICLNKRDLSGIVSVDDFQELFQHSPSTEVFETIATEGKDVRAAFNDNLEKILRRNHEFLKIKEKLLSKINPN